MALLPDEIWIKILDYLEPSSIISSLRVCTRLSVLARDNNLWRAKCFERAPSAAAAHADRPDALSALTGALGGLSLSESRKTSRGKADPEQPLRPSKRARAIARWDQTGESERIDWTSEYVARHAPLYSIWDDTKQEVRGVALHDASQKIVGALDDGSIAVWDISQREVGRRKFRQTAQSKSGILFADYGKIGGPSQNPTSTFNSVVDCVSVDSARQKAYVAVEHVINEVDLETLQVVSQSQYAWPVTALSAQGDRHVPLSVGTSWSLHLYDPRAPFRDRSRSPEDLMRATPGEPEDSIAFLPNYSKNQSKPLLEGKPLPTSSAPTSFAQVLRPRARRCPRFELSDYAQMEPGPQSILHHGENEILIGGRFPSILSYDRRFFPRLQYVIHSGARLSCLTSISRPPKASTGIPSVTSTLVACGEYNGRGSLELYAMPHGAQSGKRAPEGFGLDGTSPEFMADQREHASGFSEQDFVYNYKNRQEASSSKLLSVAIQGARIVFSDAEGGIKWVERDGRGLARRWNINQWQMNEVGGALSGELVARKLLPIETPDSDRGTRGDGDLIVFTGEKVGLITTRPQYEDHEELVQTFDNEVDPEEKEEQEKANEYSKTMRRALERQADERRWMSQFRLKRGLF